ncbi:MAG TPA: hypothetical protein PLB81_05285 [Deltaproteobacteria bacterium]|nr:hypothetical protein [Deltaproteobacteria bacterium]
MNRHHLSTGSTNCQDEPLNVFDEQVFAHTGNGMLLAIHPRHIDLSPWRTLGSIPAVVKDWWETTQGRRVILSVNDRARELFFRVDQPAEQLPKMTLHPEMTLYMIFHWDKLIELNASSKAVVTPCPV